MPDVIITPNSGLIEFRPSSTTVNKIEASGNTFNLVNTANPSGTIFNIEATNGSLFSVVDNLDGTLMSVNNNAGLPVFEVFSDDRIIGGRFGYNDFVVNSSGNVGVGLANPSTKLEVSGTIKATDFSGIGSSLTAGYAQNIVGEAGGGYSATILPPWGAIPYISEDQTTVFRLIGNSGQVLKSNGEVPVWGSVQYSDITDFNSGVSGLLPTISNSGDNRILTSTGSSLGINAESNLTFDGTNLRSPRIIGTEASGDEGGEIELAKAPNSSISGAIIIDVYQNKLRFFEQTGSNRGFYLDLSAAGASVSTNIGGGGSATTVSNYGDNRLITSDGTSTGLNAESNLIFNGNVLSVTGSGSFSNNVTASGFVRNGGTSSQFLKADGSVDSTAYTTNTGTVTSISGTGTVAGLTLTGTVTTTGNLTLGGTLSVSGSNFSSQTANTFLAAPSGSSGVPTFRAIVAGDIPTLNQNTTGNAATVTSGVYTSSNQTIGGVKTFTSQIINTTANSTSLGGGQIYLNGNTGNRIDFNISGVSDPSIFTRSIGTKISFYPSLATGTATDFAIGLGGDGVGGAGTPTRLWQSVDATTSRFQWYAAANNIATLNGIGQLEINNSGVSYTNPALTLRSTRTATNGSMRFAPQEDGAGGYITFNSIANTTTNGTLISGTSTMTGYHGSRRQGAFQWVGGTSDSTSRFEFLTANGGTTAQTMTSRMVITTEGRVGIGIIEPGYTLQLTGNIGINSSTIAEAIQISASLYYISMIDSNTNSIFNINSISTNFYNNSGGAGLYFDRNNAKVGIQTQTPSEALDVAGNIKGNNIFHPFLLGGM